MGLPVTVTPTAPDVGRPYMPVNADGSVCPAKAAMLFKGDDTPRSTGNKGILNTDNCWCHDLVTLELEYAPVPLPGGWGIYFSPSRWLGAPLDMRTRYLLVQYATFIPPTVLIIDVNDAVLHCPVVICVHVWVPRVDNIPVTWLEETIFPARGSRAALLVTRVQSFGTQVRFPFDEVYVPRGLRSQSKV